MGFVFQLKNTLQLKIRDVDINEKIKLKKEKKLLPCFVVEAMKKMEGLVHYCSGNEEDGWASKSFYQYLKHVVPMLRRPTEQVTNLGLIS
ncbi:hypothetical protein Scep_030058 [Stephania cephalantha]|uniref:Uncharacterized protein n=1 Tax=Stephania cephalantha TaxID=152367 RepID=A0AAP0E2G2_9MAGN